MARSPAPEVPVSAERFASCATGIRLCYQTFGTPPGSPGGGEPLLLVMGLSGQMTWWDDQFCTELARAGFYVIRFDNRDIGRSTKLTDEPVSRRQLARAFFGLSVHAPYSIDDMAADAFGLLDELGVTSAHVFGVSMGGMIGQSMALAHPGRVRSLTSMMSTTGRRTVGWQSPRMLPRLLAPAPKTLEELVDFNIGSWRLISSPGYPFDEADFRRRAIDSLQRGRSGTGIMRQMLAVLTQPDRTEALGGLEIPSLVIHGLQDRMVHVSGGRATALAIPGSRLLLVPGMGHDLPPELWPLYVENLRAVAGLR